MRRFFLLSLWSLLSCNEERAAIDRVQANALAKADLDGEWYFVQTVVDVPYTTEFTFIGDQSEMEKLRWEIQEHVLVAHRSYEQYEDSERKDELGDDYVGAPVAAYAIESHFDILYEYNPTTGEEVNVISENTTDRPWFEREYMRVDWSKNLVTNWSFWADKVSLEPISYFASDECDTTGRGCDDRPVFEDGYMDFTHRFLATPGEVDDPDWGTFPTCWLYFSFDDCTAQEIEVRASFLRVPDSDYEPLLWTDHDQEFFGYFDIQRYGYDDQYGPVESRRVRYATRWNLWDRSHGETSCTADDDPGESPTGGECGGGGSKCDRFRGLCTLPYRERGTKPIVYHVAPGTSAEDAEVFSGVADEFSAALVDTVDGVRENECLNDGGEASACAALRDDDLRMFVLCPHNPVAEGDPAECGPAGTAPRIGDMRHSFMYMVDQPQLGSPLGYGPSLPDPETGEIVSASAFVYGPELDTYASWARDLVALLNGEIEVDDYILGLNVRDWIEAQSGGDAGQRTLTPADVRARRDRMSLDWADAVPRIPAASGRRAKDPRALSRARQAVQGSGILAAHGPGGAARVGSLRGTPLEARLINGETLLAAGMDPSSAPTPEVVDAASPLGRLTPAALRAVSRARRQRNAHRCVWFRDFSDPGAIGWALDHRGEDPEDARRAIRAAVLRAVMAHEVGHTVGLRHNFEGSFDALNYPAEYWALRQDGFMEPRYLDPETEDELEGHIREYQYSTVMDYGAAFNTDINGLGHYDKAALKYGYGKLMEVFPNVSGDEADIANVIVLYTNFGWPMPLLYASDDSLVGLHYTEYPEYFGDLEDRRDVFYDDLVDYYGDAAWFESPITHLATATGEPIVPYRFCSDEFAGANMTCQMFDEGADLYESTRDRIDRYQNYYIFNNFKRDRVNFNPEPYVWRIYERYFEPLQSLNQWYVLLAADLFATEEPTDDIPRFLERPDGFGPLTVAVTDTFQMFAETLTMPEPGGYHLEDRPDGTRWLAPWGEDFAIGIDQGRWLETTWDFDSGYYWDDKVLRVGYFIDKALAMELLADPTTWFTGRDTASDIRQYQISFYTNFRDQMVDLFGGLMGDRIDRLAPFQTTEGQLGRRDFTDPSTGLPAGATPVDPQTGFTLQLFAAVYGMTMMSDNFDTTFIDSARVYLEGSGQGFSPLFETVTFDDPYGGKRYVAQSFPDDDGVERGVAAGVIAEANVLLAVLADEDLGDEERARADVALRNYVDNLDLMREIGEYLDLGPTSIWEQ